MWKTKRTIKLQKKKEKPTFSFYHGYDFDTKINYAFTIHWKRVAVIEKSIQIKGNIKKNIQSQFSFDVIQPRWQEPTSKE